MKTLVNLINFVSKSILVNAIYTIFLFSKFSSTTWEDNAAFHWLTRSSVDTFPLLRNIFMIVQFIGNCFTTWRWIMIWIMFMITWYFFGRCFSSRRFSVFIWLRNFYDTFVNLFLFFWNTEWFEARYIFFYARNISDLYDITCFWR